MNLEHAEDAHSPICFLCNLFYCMEHNLMANLSLSVLHMTFLFACLNRYAKPQVYLQADLSELM